MSESREICCNCFVWGSRSWSLDILLLVLLGDVG